MYIYNSREQRKRESAFLSFLAAEKNSKVVRSQAMATKEFNCVCLSQKTCLNDRVNYTRIMWIYSLDFFKVIIDSIVFSLFNLLNVDAAHAQINWCLSLTEISWTLQTATKHPIFSKVNVDMASSVTAINMQCDLYFFFNIKKE